MEVRPTKYEGYYVTEDGRVLKEVPQHETNGYLAVNVRSGDKYKLERIHRLVAEAYVGEIPKGEIVNHEDGNKKNNHYSNLVIGTYSYNNTHAKRTGLNKNIGEKSHYARLTEKEVISMYREYKAGATAKEMALKYNISPQTVYAIVNGRRWKHIIETLG